MVDELADGLVRVVPVRCHRRAGHHQDRYLLQHAVACFPQKPALILRLCIQASVIGSVQIAADQQREFDLRRQILRLRLKRVVLARLSLYNPFQ